MNTQFDVLQKLFDHPQFLPDELPRASELCDVLEVAAGTARWAFGLAFEPGVREKIAAGKLRIFASDISLSLLPPEDVARQYGVELFQHDITKPFPEEMHEKFDLVRMSLVAFALTKDMWEVALKNILQVVSE